MQLTKIEKYENAYNAFKEKKISKEAYELFLSEQDEYYFYGEFCKSRYLFKLKDLTNAKTHIHKAVNLLENHSLFNNPTDGLLTGDDVLHPHVYSNIYNLAGQIYAKCDDHDKSLSYYKKYQYYISQLDSGFNDILNGAYVYSFRSVSKYSLSDLIANAITVARPSKMNDPFDSLFMLWASKENLEKVCNEKKHILMLAESFKYYRIRSFVGNNNLIKDDMLVNNVIMWSHYADDHQGYCIRYKLSRNFVVKQPDGTFTHHYLRKVEYIDEGKPVSVVSSKTNTTELFTTKSEKWSGESEIRLVSYDSSYDGDFLQIKLDDCSAIDAIYFGYRCPVSDKRDIMTLIGPKAEYYEMVLNPEDVYSMTINKIEYNPSNT